MNTRLTLVKKAFHENRKQTVYFVRLKVSLFSNDSVKKMSARFPLASLPTIKIHVLNVLRLGAVSSFLPFWTTPFPIFAIS